MSGRRLKISTMAVWQVTSAPSVEPLTRSEMKNYLKVPSATTADDDLIDDLIVSARQFVERYTSRALIVQTITEYFDAFPVGDRLAKSLDPRVLQLHIAPVVSISAATGLAYIPEDGTPDSYTAWDNTANAKYFLDIISGSNGIGPARICKRDGIDWPTIEPYANAVKVTYVAGYGAAGSNVPAMIKTAMRRIIGTWYFHRKTAQNEWQDVFDLLAPFKVHK